MIDKTNNTAAHINNTTNNSLGVSLSIRPLNPASNEGIINKETKANIKTMIIPASDTNLSNFVNFSNNSLLLTTVSTPSIALICSTVSSYFEIYVVKIHTAIYTLRKGIQSVGRTNQVRVGLSAATAAEGRYVKSPKVFLHTTYSTRKLSGSETS